MSKIKGTVKANFTQADLAKLTEAKDREHAQTLLRAIVEAAGQGEHPIKPEKVQQLFNNISHARSKNEVIAIGWNMLLAGEGLATMGSKYQKRFG